MVKWVLPQIADNRFERVKNTEGMALGYRQVMGIYLDGTLTKLNLAKLNHVMGIYLEGTLTKLYLAKLKHVMASISRVRGSSRMTIWV